MDINEIARRLRHEVRLPEMTGERCVHALVEVAGCRACEEVCPHSAWALDDQALRLDTDRCDGCGLCAAACPEGAIRCRQEIATGVLNGRQLALCACEKAGLSSRDGVIPCLHAISLNDILALYRDGVRIWLAASADCAQCERGGGETLFERLFQVNTALASRQATQLLYGWRHRIEWERIRQRIDTRFRGPGMTRRGLLRGALEQGVEQGLRRFGLGGDASEAFTPPGGLMPARDQPAVWPRLPVIDGTRCDGCDACVKLCPHHAIAYEEQGNRAVYRVQARDCTGCGICSDACGREAIRVDAWQTGAGDALALQRFVCRACGNPFHLPVREASDPPDRCRVCQRRDNRNRLYQVVT